MYFFYDFSSFFNPNLLEILDIFMKMFQNPPKSKQIRVEKMMKNHRKNKFHRNLFFFGIGKFVLDPHT